MSRCRDVHGFAFQDSPGASKLVSDIFEGIPEHEVGISDLHGWISQPASKLEISPRRREAGCRQLLQRRKYPAKMAEPGAGFGSLRARGAPATCACGRANRSSSGARTPAGADASPRRVSSRRLRQRTLEADSKRLGDENAAAPVVKPKNAGTDVTERGNFWGRSAAPRLADWAGRPPGRRRVPTCAAAGAHPHWERAG